MRALQDRKQLLTGFRPEDKQGKDEDKLTSKEKELKEKLKEYVLPKKGTPLRELLTELRRVSQRALPPVELRIVQDAVRRVAKVCEVQVGKLGMLEKYA